MSKKIAVLGATGFIGSTLRAYLGAQGYTVISADVRKTRDLSEHLRGAHAIVNLGGAPIFGQRWTEARKKLILESRTQGTRKILEALAQLPTSDRAQVLLNASAIGYYGPREDEDLNEHSSAGDDFLAHVCQQWEAAALEGQALGLRVVLPRIGIVLGAHGGALEQMLPPFRVGLGGPLGDGHQWFSWIHLEDTVRALHFLLEQENLGGPVNLTAPHPTRNRDFAKLLGRQLHRPAILPTPPWALKLLLGQSAEVLTSGQKVLPECLLKSGFQFQFDRVEKALEDICPS